MNKYFIIWFIFVERAEFVKTYMVSNGIALRRLAAVGSGKNNFVEDNKTEVRAVNGRIGFKISK